MTEWDINQIFKVCDFNRDDNIDMNEWRVFRSTFIAKFEEQDTENSLYVDAAKTSKSMADIAGVKELTTNSTLWEFVVNDISGRNGDTKDKLNFAEWLFVRVVSVSWGISAGQRITITRDELLDIGLKIFPSLTTYDADLKNVIFGALD